MSTPSGITPAPSSSGMIVNPRTEVSPTIDRSLYPKQRECVPVGTDLSEMGNLPVQVI